VKKQKKSIQGLYLHKTNTRWKWMAGATAAGVTTSQAITINLIGNYISATGGNHLNADLTGDGQADLTIANSFYRVLVQFTSNGVPLTQYNKYFATVSLNGVLAQVYVSNDYGRGYVTLGLQHKSFYRRSGSPSYASVTESIPLIFKDLHINGGALTKGSLEVTVSGAYGTAKIQLDSFTYNTPDEGSSLALLAMGAGGILAFRRLRTAQARS
jgi:hypothetical protein